MALMSSRHRALLATSIAALAALALTGCGSAPALKSATPNASISPDSTQSSAPQESQNHQNGQQQSFPADHRSDVKAGPNDAFALFRKRVDPGGTSHERFTRTFHGLPVYGGDVVLHLDKNGAVQGTSNSLAAP